MGRALKTALSLSLPPLLFAAGASSLFALPKGGAESEGKTQIRNSEVNLDVNVGEIKAAGKTNINVGSVDSGKSGTISNMKINTEVNADSINAKRNDLNVGNVNMGGRGGASDLTGHGITAHRGAQTDNIGNVTVEGGRVKEVTTVVGGDFTDKIKERNKSNTLADNDGVDGRGVKHVYVGRDDIKEAEADKRRGEGPISLGNTTVGGAEGGNVKKVKTFVEAAGKALGGGRNKSGSKDSPSEE